jgi:hypothetical protein
MRHKLLDWNDWNNQAAWPNYLHKLLSLLSLLSLLFLYMILLNTKLANIWIFHESSTGSRHLPRKSHNTRWGPPPCAGPTQTADPDTWNSANGLWNPVNVSANMNVYVHVYVHVHVHVHIYIHVHTSIEVNMHNFKGIEHYLVQISSSIWV